MGGQFHHPLLPELTQGPWPEVMSDVFNFRIIPSLPRTSSSKGTRFSDGSGVDYLTTLAYLIALQNREIFNYIQRISRTSRYRTEQSLSTADHWYVSCERTCLAWS